VAVKTKSKKIPPPSCVNDEEAAELNRQIAEHFEHVRAIDLKLERSIARLKAKAAEMKKTEMDEAKRLAEGIHAYALKNRSKIEDVGTKTLVLPYNAGKLCWRLPPESLVIEDEKATLQKIEDDNRSDLIRTKKEIDKEKLADDRAYALGLPGVEFKQIEKFVLYPPDIECRLEIPESGPRRLWSVVEPEKKQAA
jgi:phage host-nuclease inhibitor protein Gam